MCLVTKASFAAYSVALQATIFVHCPREEELFDRQMNVNTHRRMRADSSLTYNKGSDVNKRSTYQKF